MKVWSEKLAEEKIFRFRSLSKENQNRLILFLNKSFPPEVYEKQILYRRRALNNLVSRRNILLKVEQYYPECISINDIDSFVSDLKEYAIIFTAGGEGERLRLSLKNQGITQDKLHDFTKATFPLPDFYLDFGTLQINLCLISSICRNNNVNIPVIVSTGPERSVTARVITKIIHNQNHFGLKNLRIIHQDERLHFTLEEQIVYTFVNKHPRPVTHPDETGGPIMKLKKSTSQNPESTLVWLKKSGCNKIILLQATALYNPDLIFKIASAGKNYDGLGVGIKRDSFPDNDPYGTYILIEKDRKMKLIIAEQEERNKSTLSIIDPHNNSYLPYNTGIYAFNIDLISINDLPDYATPPKEILPDIAKSAKIGYSATDIISYANKPGVLTVPKNSFCVMKNINDIKRLSLLSKKFGLHNICREIHES